jgi:hypothetical protein
MPQLKTNKRKRILIQCSTAVDRNAVSRKSIGGVEHIVVSSHTLPDDIVMNGGLYPAEEIESSFATLERTLAPVEHPTDAAGNFISANDPAAIHNFYAGAFNENVRQENGRVSLDKVINVQEALKTDRGKRLLDRIEELETNETPRPMHTSTGVFLEVEELDGPQTNAAGQKYTWIARNMVFDHDAILLESVAAAQPHQGVGMGVNRDGEEVTIQQYVLDKANALVTVETDPDEEMSHSEVAEALSEAIRQPPLRGDWIAEVFEDRVIFWSDELLFSAPYVMDGKTAKIVGIPIPVDRDVAYIPKTNRKGDAMKDLMLNALKAAGVEVSADISEADLLAKYNELQAAQNSDNSGDAAGDTADIAAVVANALKPVVEQLDGLTAQINQKVTDELDRLADIVGNSDKYPGLDVDAAKKLDVGTLKGMAANCVPAHGVPLLTVVNSGDDDDSTSYEMPK